MIQPATWLENDELETPEEQTSGRLSFLKFLLRYPIFILAFGPPIFRAPSANAGVDTAQAHFDIWNIIQVGWISVIALRAILRLAFAQSILIPKQIQFILKLAFFLGLLFLISVLYSPGRIISAEFSILNFFTLICVAEFIADVYQNPPNWMQCLFHLRTISLLLLAVLLLLLPIEPSYAMSFAPGVGIRLLGGTIAPTTVICPVIAIISAYSFMYFLEPRIRSALFFMIGLAGTLATQTRGSEIALFVVLAILSIGWAKRSKRSAYIVISGLMAFILMAGGVVGAVGGERILSAFNRGQDAEGIANASGRTFIWEYAIEYCMAHPQGMGYVSGFRTYFTHSFDLSYGGMDVTKLGNCHNSFMQVLADAGWLALALYLLMMAKIVLLGWRFAKKNAVAVSEPDRAASHAIRCALLLLVFCFVCGMEASDFVTPLRTVYYFQYIIIAIILGASESLLIASRPRYTSLAR